MKNTSIKKEVGKFLGLFLILYLIVFVVLNITGWLVRPKPLEVSSGITHSRQEEESAFLVEESKCAASEKPDSILIAKIGIEAPLVFIEDSNGNFIDALNRGVVFYPGSSLPGQKGETVLLGHSAPLGWPKIRYDWVFSDLHKLELEDEIYIFYENCQYIYKVNDKIFLERGEELPDTLTDSKNVLILISCWPPGKDIRRIAVKADLYENYAKK